jgi:hypothetical protein
MNRNKGSNRPLRNDLFPVKFGNPRGLKSRPGVGRGRLELPLPGLSYPALRELA